MNKIINRISTWVAVATALGSLKLHGQILEYHFSGTVEGNHPDVDFFAEELEYSDGVIQFGDEVSGTIKVDPVREMRLTGPIFPQNNLIYSGGLLDMDVKINGERFIASEGRHSMDVGTFDNAETQPDGLQYPLGDAGADAVIFVSFVGIERTGNSEERFSFMLNFTDSSGAALQGAGFPESVDLEQYDLAKGFIRPSNADVSNGDFGAMFQINSFELIATLERQVIAAGPKSQIVEAGDSIRLTMAEVLGNMGVECQWSLNGVDLPGETLPGLTLDNLQPRQAGTYRVTAWNNLGTTNVASARIEVRGARHRSMPVAVSGWNVDMIAASDEDPNDQLRFDGESAFWFAADYQEHPDGFPNSGKVTSAVNADVHYQIQPYDAENVLWLAAADEEAMLAAPHEISPAGNLDLVRAKKYTSLALLAASSGGSGDDEGTLVLHFADGSSSDEIGFNAGDWWTIPERSAAAAIAGLGRFNGLPGEAAEHDSPEGYGFGLYETEIDLVELGLADKELTSIEFHKPASSMSAGIFAVSGQSAELMQGFHVSWPLEGERELFEVAVSPDGPWLPLGSEVQTIGTEQVASVASDRMPRFSRSLLRDLSRELHTHYDFSREGRDRLGSSMRMEPIGDVEFVDGTVMLRNDHLDPAGSSGTFSAIVPRLNYIRYTLSLDFFPLEGSSEGNQTIVNGGTLTRWIRLYTDQGRLAVSFDDSNIEEVFDGVEVLPGQWHRVIISVDTRIGSVDLMLDGAPLWSFDLGGRYSYKVSSTSTPESVRALNFSGTNDSEAFAGYLDNLMVFRRGLNREEMSQLHEALDPSPLAFGIGSQRMSDDEFSVGMHLSWENNLEGFELQESGALSGPWSSVEPFPAEFDKRFLFPMSMDAAQAIYRLRTPF